MTRRVCAPVSGTVRELHEVPDPVFAQEMIGSGLVIEPEEGETFDVLSPLCGRVLTLHPHAAVVLGERDDPGEGAAPDRPRTAGPRGVLVHVGIDTVKLRGRGFLLRVRAGEHVEVGQPLITVETAPAREAGLSLLVPVIAMETPADQLDGRAAPGLPIAAGDQLYTWL